MDKQKTRLATMQILFFYIEMNTSNTFYSSTNETKGLLPSFATIDKVIYEKKHLINAPRIYKMFLQLVIIVVIV